jgi:hypothetical protein
MKLTLVLFILLLALMVVPCLAQEYTPSTKESQKKASESGMQYGSILIGLVIMIALPTVLLLLIAKIAGLGVEEVGVVKCLYTNIIFFVVVGLVFYNFSEGLEVGLSDPAEFFNNTMMLIGLGIAFATSFLLMYFMLSSSLVRSLIGTILFIVGFYGITILAYKLILATGAEGMLKKGLESSGNG